jgi:ABC-type nitrate/sulfonate/bicarbonate transport system substrate-binding protein
VSTKSLAFQFNWITNVQFSGSYLAQTKGYYSANHVDVDLRTGGPNVSVIPVLQSKAALVGVVDPPTSASANAQGADIVIVGSVYQKSPSAIISLAKAPITTPQEMVGKKIGVGASSVQGMKEFMAANHLAYSSITVVPIQDNPAPLAAGQVDGYLGFSTNEAIILELGGHPVHVMLMADYGLDAYEDSYGVLKSSLQDADSRQAIKSFLTGEILGWQDVVADPQEATDVTISKYGSALKLDGKQQLAECEAQNQLVVSPDTKAHGLFWMADATIEKNLKTCALGGSPATTALFDNSLLAEIYDGKTSLTPPT